jgi:hypothetical protein
MEGHAAFPDSQDRAGIGQIESRLVEQHEAQPPAQYHAQNHPGQDIVDLLGSNQMRRPVGQSQAVAPSQQHPPHIGKRVPANGKRAQLYGYRVEVGENEIFHARPALYAVWYRGAPRPLVML